MSGRSAGQTVALAGAPIGAAVGVALGAVYGDIVSFAVAGAIIGVVLSALTLIFAVARISGELSWAQFASGLMLVGAVGFALAAISVPQHPFLYGALAVTLCVPAVIWLGFTLWTRRLHVS